MIPLWYKWTKILSHFITDDPFFDTWTSVVSRNMESFDANLVSKFCSPSFRSHRNIHFFTKMTLVFSLFHKYKCPGITYTNVRLLSHYNLVYSGLLARVVLGNIYRVRMGNLLISHGEYWGPVIISLSWEWSLVAQSTIINIDLSQDNKLVILVLKTYRIIFDQFIYNVKLSLLFSWIWAT